MLRDIIDVLRCPVCDEPLRLDGSVRCGNGHSFDIARQGYVNLQAGKAAATADTADMVAARAEFLAGGHYDEIVSAVAAAAADLVGSASTPLVVDAGAGTGYWLAAVLGRLPGARGLALDSSKHAARRGARANPRIGAAVCDTWRRLPVADGAASLVLNVFAPRNGGEFARVLRPDGALLVVTPTPRHLAEVVTEFGLVTVDHVKDVRLIRSLASHFDLVSRDEITTGLELGPDDLRRIVRMGPSAWHVPDEEMEGRLPAQATIQATAATMLSVYRPSSATHSIR